jgi:hypothetical protein
LEARNIDCAAQGSNYFVQKTGSTPACAQAAGGGGGSATPLSALALMPWGLEIITTAYIAEAPGQGISQVFTVQEPVTIARVSFWIGAPSGTGCTGGICGLRFGIYSADGATQHGVTSVGTSGGSTDINSTGYKSLPFSSGSCVSGGICTLQPGTYLLVAATDSIALGIGASGTAANLGMAILGQSASGGSAIRYGDSSTTLGTGNGDSFSLDANISGDTFAVSAKPFVMGLVR